MEGSFAVGMPIHWAEFYDDSKMCQEAELNLAKVHFFEAPSQGYLKESWINLMMFVTKLDKIRML